MTEQLRIAVIGTGYWGGNYVRTFTELPSTQVVAICDQRQENLDKITHRFPDLISTTEVDDILKMGDVDAIVVCTNASTHYDITSRCLGAGKHVLLEKPMTLLADESEKLLKISKENGVILMVGHIYLYNNGIRMIKDYIDNGDIGQLYYLYTQRTNLGPIRHDVNALWDLAPHDISILNYLLGGTPEWVSAVAHNVLHKGNEDVGFITLGYSNDVVGNVHVSWADPNKVREVVAVGSEMRIVFDDMKPMEPVRLFQKGVQPASAGDIISADYRFSIRNGDIISPNVPASEPLRAQCQHFIECIIDGKQPLTDAQNGLDVVRVMNAVNKSVENKGAPVTL